MSLILIGIVTACPVGARGALAGVEVRGTE